MENELASVALKLSDVYNNRAVRNITIFVIIKQYFFLNNFAVIYNDINTYVSFCSTTLYSINKIQSKLNYGSL